jgi:hypothetical protein
MLSIVAVCATICTLVYLVGALKKAESERNKLLFALRAVASGHGEIVDTRPGYFKVEWRE